MDRLSSDDNGELLLQPIGYCSELVDGLASMAIDKNLPLERRTDSARTLLGIAQKAADDNIVFVNARAVSTLSSGYNSSHDGAAYRTVCSLVSPNRCSHLFTLLLVIQSMYDSQPTTTVVPNRLSSVRHLLHGQLRLWLPNFCAAVTNCDKCTSGMLLHKGSLH